MKNYQSRTRLAGIVLCTLVATLMSLSGLAIGTVQAATDLPYYNAAEFTPHWFEGGHRLPADFHRIPAFSLRNQDDKTVDLQTVKNKVYVASFFFSTCPGICPAIRSKLAKVQDAFRHDDGVLILSHSIRPTTDTPEVLRTYANNNGVESGKWHLLTGSQHAIYTLAKSAYFANEDLGDIKDLNDFLHTENLLLIDSTQRIRGIYNGLSASSVNHLITDIAVLRSKPDDEQTGHRP